MPANFNTQDKFDATKGFSQVRFGSDTKLLEVELNEMQKIQNHQRAELNRSTVHSGLITKIPAFTTSTSKPDVITLSEASEVNMNGYKVPIPANTDVSLPPAPTFGSTDVLAFFESWFEEVDYTKDASLMDTRYNQETARRVKLNWRIRTVAGVDFGKYPEGLHVQSTPWTLTDVQPQGSLSSPLAPSVDFRYAFTSAITYSARNWYTEDKGLFYAGDGTQASKDALKTVDGYVYAIPLFRVKRRNSGGYRADNVNGARDYYKPTSITRNTIVPVGSTGQWVLSSDYDKVQVGDILKADDPIPTQWRVQVLSKDGSNTVTIKNLGLIDTPATATSAYYIISDRQDGKYSNIIDKDDIIDLRHKVSLTGYNYDQLLEENFDKLLRGELQTKDKPVMVKERFGLHPAPLGLATQLVPTKVKGNDLVDRELVNLLGIDGNCETTVKWFNVIATLGIDPNFSTEGKNSILATATATGGNGGRLPVSVSNAKYYIIISDFNNVNMSNVSMYAIKGSDGATPIKIGTSSAVVGKSTQYVKLSPTDIGSETSLYVYPRGFSTAIGQKFNFDGIRVYEIDQATYDKIDVDAEFTGDKLAQKFPYVSSYPNVVDNLNSSDLEEGSITTGSGTNATGAGWVRTKDFISIKANTVYKTTLSNMRVIFWYDVNKVYISDSGGSSPVSWTSPSNAVYAKIRTYSADTIDNVKKNFMLIESGKAEVPFVPYGRWLTPPDYANGDTPNRLLDYNSHRKTYSDAQTSEAVTEFVDPVSSSHQPHITPTQATAGVWNNGDTIKVKSDNGVITGAIDADTALANIIGVEGNNTLLLDSVSALAVGDSFRIHRLSDNSYFAIATVSSIDSTNKKIVTDITSLNSALVGYQLIETLSSSSSPVTTATGLVGTWTNLGTNQATFTITTKPTTNTDLIKIDYTVNYPAGKGIVNLPSEVLGAKVNGLNYVKSDTLKLKANFDGKVASSVIENPHIIKYINNAPLATGVVAGFAEGNQTNYTNESKLDGVNYAVTTSGNLQVAQQLFSFNLIEEVERQMGRIPKITVAEKVQWLKDNIKTLTGNWYGFGSGPLGNKATYVPWKVDSLLWWTGYATNHTNGATTSRTRAMSGTDMLLTIDANGFMHWLAYAEPSDGVTASTINTDYVDLDIEINVADTGYDVFVPEEPLKVKNDDPRLFNEGENMIPPLSDPRWYIHANAVVNGDYDVTLNSTGSFQSSYVDIPVSANQVYSFSGVTSDATNGRYLYTFLDSTKTNIGVIATLGALKTITSPSNAVWVRVQIDNSTIVGTFNFKNPMLTVGPVARAFVPYTKFYKRKRKLDFGGKIVGSVFERPHRGLYKYATTFDAPSTFSTESDQTAYDGLAKLDGTLVQRTVATVGQYTQQLFEFDLSHLGLSLAQLKLALKTLTVNWTGYGKGEKDKIVDPTSAPTAVASGTGNTLPTGTYYVKYTWVNANGETVASPVSAGIAITIGQKLDVTIPALPTNATSANIYISTTSGSETKQGNTATTAYSQTGVLVAGTALPASNATGILGYGATVKFWYGNGSNIWGWSTSNTSSVPSVVSNVTAVTDTYKFATDNQKVYILVHSTYPASATYPSEIYTDHTNLVVELADWVDNVKKNAVKVRKETKELKLYNPIFSPMIGRSDVVELFYKTIPYQGVGLAGDMVKGVYDSPFMYVVTLGTGVARSNILSNSLNINPATITSQIPVAQIRSHLYTNQEVLFSGDATLVIGDSSDDISRFFRNFRKISRDPRAFGSFFTGVDGKISQTLAGFTPARGFTGDTSNPLFYKAIQSSQRLAKPIEGLIILPSIVVKDNSLLLVIESKILTGSANLSLYDWVTHSVDFFYITGKPLIKGVN